ncbi:MAG: 3-deoxy-manno-octulosonate cytidylyltransferase [Synergistaceae bacterium]|jgi:3-deoxy-manno-octulosonate cytidylyltransferase (CMP-KDO synthetase)|nr:3-deoxy-manno-octulosonate cytidylyltransferase [Synergistaceae bacterium]
MSFIDTLAVIPARLNSTRLPKKPLLKLGGRELVLWVLDGVRQSRLVDRVIVATDDESVASVIRSAGGEAMMTPSDLPTGSDRVAYVANLIPSRIVLNVQGDDPMVSAAVIDPMVGALSSDPEVELVVLAKKIENRDEIKRDSIVKIVFDINHKALYFSRSPIPYERAPGTEYFKHIGPYAWRRDALFEFASWPQGPLEKAESLEMLRMLERGRTIECIETDDDSIEIDTPDDVRMFDEAIKKKKIRTWEDD